MFKRSWLNLCIFLCASLLIAAGAFFAYYLKQQKSDTIYWVETLVYPAPTLILDKKGNLLRSVDSMISDIDSKFGVALATSHHDVIYYDTAGKIRFHLKTQKNIHHAIIIHPVTGELYIIANQVKDYFGTPALIDSVERYSLEGKLLASFDGMDVHQQLFNTFKPFLPTHYQQLGRLPLNPFGYQEWGSSHELFHFNYLQAIPANSSSKQIPGLEEGNILLTEPYFGTLFALDAKTLQIKWLKAFALDHLDKVQQSWMMSESYVTGFIVHSGQVLADGSIIVFRNQDFVRTMNCDLRRPPETPCSEAQRKLFHGSAMIFDPITNRELWKVETGEFLDLDTIIQGSAVVNPMGNIVLTNSDRAKFYEVDRSGKIIFEFSLDQLFAPDEKSRIYRVREFSRAEVLPLLETIN